MNIGTYSYEEYLQLVKSFYGHVAPGSIIDGFIVDLAGNETYQKPAAGSGIKQKHRLHH